MYAALKMRVKWKATPAEVRAAFAIIAEGLRDWTPAMVRLRQVFASMFAGIFASGGADLDGSWAPVSEETLRRRLRAGGEAGRATLRATGALEDSLTSDSAEGRIRQVIQPKDGVPRIVWGTKLPQAAALQMGSPKRGMPARRFVGLTDEAQEEIADILQEQINRRFAAAAAALGGKG